MDKIQSCKLEEAMHEFFMANNKIAVWPPSDARAQAVLLMKEVRDKLVIADIQYSKGKNILDLVQEIKDLINLTINLSP
jgi:hypothetical protein